MIAPCARHRHFFPALLNPWLEIDGALLFGVNSCHRCFLQHGVISQRQISKVAARLRNAAPKQSKIVATQHHLLLTADR